MVKRSCKFESFTMACTLATSNGGFYHVQVCEHEAEFVVVREVFSEPVSDADQTFDLRLILRVPVPREKLLA